MVKLLYAAPQPHQCQPEGQQDVTLPFLTVRPFPCQIELEVELALEFLVVV